MLLLDNPIRTYAWGSRTVLAGLQGRPSPTAEPEAELWMGAHPDSPSSIRHDGAPEPLDAVVAASPRVLGDATVARFGARLPFMLKMLAAASPLSLQAHPDPARAAKRYAEESSLPADQRLYRDPYAKPELLVATDDFDALCGFRDPADSADVLSSLRLPALAPIVTLLRTGTVADRLRNGIEALLRWPATHRAAIVEAVVAAARTRGLDYVVALGERFPDDMGVVVALLCNRVILAVDDAVYMPAGNLHAYLRGTGMEVLASSDNVLRGGFTSKRVDVDELLAVLSYEVLAEPVVKPIEITPGAVTWPAPAPEFSLARVIVDGGRAVDLDPAGPRIAFCQRGTVTIDDETALTMTAGQGAFGSPGRRLTIEGDGVVFVASTGV